MTGLRKLSKGALALLAIGPAMLVVVALFFALPWLEALPEPIALTLTIGAGLAVLVWALYISALFNRRQDEVERASSRDAWQHGTTAGSIAIALLLMVPPVGDGIIAAANATATALKGNTEKAPLLAFVGGFMALTFAQVIGAFVAASLWWRAKR